MASAKIDLKVEKGATFKKRLIIKDSNKNPIDLTGYIARMHIRPNARSSVIIMDLTTTNSRILITPLQGQIDLIITDEDTSGITFNGSALYDLELEDSGGEVFKIARGLVFFIEEITY